jgi:hypothetical protein
MSFSRRTDSRRKGRIPVPSLCSGCSFARPGGYWRRFRSFQTPIAGDERLRTHISSRLARRHDAHELTLEVFDDAIGRDRLGQDDGAALDVPGDDDLSGRQSQAGGNVLDLRDIERVLDPSLTAERRVGLEQKAVRSCPDEQVGLGIPEVELDLVHCRLDLERVGGEVVEARNIEAGGRHKRRTKSMGAEHTC